MMGTKRWKDSSQRNKGWREALGLAGNTRELRPT